MVFYRNGTNIIEGPGGYTNFTSYQEFEGKMTESFGLVAGLRCYMEHPTTNIQAPEKLQIPIFNRFRDDARTLGGMSRSWAAWLESRIWRLDFGSSLDLGCWRLDVASCVSD